MEKTRIVVVGGGFAGIRAVQVLLRSKDALDITLVSKTDQFQYYPTLYKLVTGALAIEAAVPLRRIFPTDAVTILIATMTTADFQSKTITLSDNRKIPYDYLVLALGSETNYFNIPGLKDHSFSFKSVDEALRLKEHFNLLFAESEGKTKEELVAQLQIMVVGGGPSGVELAGDLMSYLRRLASLYNVDPSFISIDLIEASSRVLSVMPPIVSQKANKRLRTLDINIYPNRAITAQELESVIMKTMSVNSKTVIWTAGTSINTLYTTIPGIVLTARKRVAVTDTLSLADHAEVFVVGDGADTPRTGLAQTAIYDGGYVANQILRDIKHQKRIAYIPPVVAYVVPIGDYWGLFVYNNNVWSGFIPWLIRSIVDFRYFASIVPLWYVLDVYKQGRKYRKLECKTKFHE